MLPPYDYICTESDRNLQPILQHPYIMSDYICTESDRNLQQSYLTFS